MISSTKYKIILHPQLLSNQESIGIKQVCIESYVAEGCKDKGASLNILEHPYDNLDFFLESRNYLHDLTEKYITVLTNQLNFIHEVNYSTKFWTIVLKPWLNRYLISQYEKYVVIESLVKKYPLFEYDSLNEDLFVYKFRDMADLSFLLPDYDYRLQQYTQLLNFFGKIPSDIVNYNIYSKEESKEIYNFNYFSKRLIGFVLNFLGSSGKKSNKIFFLKNSYFPIPTLFKIFFYTKSKMEIDLLTDKQLEYNGVDQKSRDILKASIPTINSFEEYLKRHISQDIPQNVIESFSDIGKISETNFPKKVTHIFSANGWYNDTYFTRWSAECAEKYGTVLLGTQHGANYGISRYHYQTFFETDISDIYYSWGWRETHSNSLLKQMPATKFCNLKKIDKPSFFKERILFVASTKSTFSTGMLFQPKTKSNYIRNQKEFFDSLSVRLQNSLLFRGKKDGIGLDMGWSDYVKSDQIEFANKSRSLRYSIANSRIVVCDYFSTTFSELLVYNKPSILFWNPDEIHNKVTPEVEPYFQLLRDVGILYNTPEEAAQQLEKVFDKVDQWWFDVNRQKVIGEFIYHCSRLSKNSIQEWINEFDKL